MLSKNSAAIPFPAHNHAFLARYCQALAKSIAFRAALWLCICFAVLSFSLFLHFFPFPFSLASFLVALACAPAPLAS